MKLKTFRLISLLAVVTFLGISYFQLNVFIVMGINTVLVTFDFFGVKFINILIFTFVNAVALVFVSHYDFSFWWILASEIFLWYANFSWKTWKHPANQLANQATYMNWIRLRTDISPEGFRNNVYKKDEIVALISFEKECVLIIEPFEAGPFKDFIDIDRFLINRKENDPSIKRSKKTENRAPKFLEVEKKVEELVSKLRSKGRPVPAQISDLPDFPFDDFDHLNRLFLSKDLLLQRFKFEYLGWAFDILSFPSDRFYANFYLFIQFLVPVISFVLCFFISRWFLIGIVFFPIGLKGFKNNYNRVIYRSGFQSEFLFCFLYYCGQICVTTSDFKHSYFWKQDGINKS